MIQYSILISTSVLFALCAKQYMLTGAAGGAPPLTNFPPSPWRVFGQRPHSGMQGSGSEQCCDHPHNAHRHVETCSRGRSSHPGSRRNKPRSEGTSPCSPCYYSPSESPLALIASTMTAVGLVSPLPMHTHPHDDLTPDTEYSWVGVAPRMPKMWKRIDRGSTSPIRLPSTRLPSVAVSMHRKRASLYRHISWPLGLLVSGRTVASGFSLGACSPPLQCRPSKHCTQLKRSGTSRRRRPELGDDEVGRDSCRAPLRCASKLSLNNSAMSMNSPLRMRATSLAGTGGRPSLRMKGLGRLSDALLVLPCSTTPGDFAPSPA